MARVDDRRAKNQILRGIADDGELGQHHEIRAAGRRPLACASNAREVAADVADRRIELRERDG